MEINCFTIGGNAWDSWRGRSLLSLTCAAFNSFGNNLLYSGQQLFAKWNFTASGRTRKPLTAELLGVSSLTEISHNNTSETYECHTVYTADAGGNILALPPWGSFGFPFELETDPADGYAESWLRGGAVGFYGGSFVFIHGS